MTTDPGVPRPVTLTEDERESLCICPDLAGTGSDFDDEELIRVCNNNIDYIESMVQQRMADAWTDGYDAGMDGDHAPWRKDNPYRSQP